MTLMQTVRILLLIGGCYANKGPLNLLTPMHGLVGQTYDTIGGGSMVQPPSGSVFDSSIYNGCGGCDKSIREMAKAQADYNWRESNFERHPDGLSIPYGYLRIEPINR